MYRARLDYRTHAYLQTCTFSHWRLAYWKLTRTTVLLHSTYSSVRMRACTHPHLHGWWEAAEEWAEPLVWSHKHFNFQRVKLARCSHMGVWDQIRRCRVWCPSSPTNQTHFLKFWNANESCGRLFTLIKGSASACNGLSLLLVVVWY